MSESSGSITTLLFHLRKGDNDSVAELLRRWYDQLCRKLTRHTKSLSICDEEDIALNAIYDLCDALKQNNTQHIDNRNELWRLLSVIALRKTRDWKKYDNAKKREGIQEDTNDACATAVADSQMDDIVLFNELLDQLLDDLKDEELKTVVRLRLAGNTNTEIAEKIGCSRRTVQYMLTEIREVWSQSLQ